MLPQSRIVRILSGLVVLLLLPGSLLRSQEPAEALEGAAFRTHAGLIINRAFSNIGEKLEVIDEFTSISKTPSDSAGNVKTGFIVGGEALTRGKNVKAAFGISFVSSGAVYHSSFQEEGRTNRQGFTHMKRNTELDYVESFFYLDLSAGLRVMITKNLFVTGGFAFNRPLSVRRESEGYVSTTYSAIGSPDTETTIVYLEEPRKKVKGESNLSFRLKAEYEFPVGSSEGSVYLFRNFGFIYTLPWWGFGVSYSFR